MKNEYASLLSSSSSSPSSNRLNSSTFNSNSNMITSGKYRFMAPSSSSSSSSSTFSTQSQQKSLQSQSINNIDPALSPKINRSSSLPLKIMFKQQQQQQNHRHSNAIPISTNTQNNDKFIAKSWNGHSNNSPTFPLNHHQQQQHQRISSTSKITNNSNAKTISTPFFNNGNFLSYKYTQLSLSEHFLNLIEQQHYHDMKQEQRFKQQRNNTYNVTTANSSTFTSETSSLEMDDIQPVIGVASSLDSSYSSSSGSSPNDDLDENSIFKINECTVNIFDNEILVEDDKTDKNEKTSCRNENESLKCTRSDE